MQNNQRPVVSVYIQSFKIETIRSEKLLVKIPSLKCTQLKKGDEFSLAPPVFARVRHPFQRGCERQR